MQNPNFSVAAIYKNLKNEEFSSLCGVAKLNFSNISEAKQKHLKSKNYFSLGDCNDFGFPNTSYEPIALQNFDTHLISVGVGKNEITAFNFWRTFKKTFPNACYEVSQSLNLVDCCLNVKLFSQVFKVSFLGFIILSFF